MYAQPMEPIGSSFNSRDIIYVNLCPWAYDTTACLWKYVPLFFFLFGIGLRYTVLPLVCCGLWPIQLKANFS